MRDLIPTDPYNLAPQYILDRLEIPEENFYQFTIEGIPCQILRHPKMGFLLGYSIPGTGWVRTPYTMWKYTGVSHGLSSRKGETVG